MVAKQIEITFNRHNGPSITECVSFVTGTVSKCNFIDSVKRHFRQIFPDRIFSQCEYYNKGKKLDCQVDINEIDKIEVFAYHCVSTVTIIKKTGKTNDVRDFCYDVETKTHAELIELFKEYCGVHHKFLDFSEFAFYSNDAKLPSDIQDLTFDHLDFKN